MWCALAWLLHFSRERDHALYLMCDDSIHLKLPRQLQLLGTNTHTHTARSYALHWNDGNAFPFIIHSINVDKMEWRYGHSWSQNLATTIELSLVAHKSVDERRFVRNKRISMVLHSIENHFLRIILKWSQHGGRKTTRNKRLSTFREITNSLPVHHLIYGNDDAHCGHN